MYPFYLSLYAFYQRNMRNILFIFFFSFLLRAVVAQTGDTGYTFLRYPSSARANAMGGNTMSLVERDPSLIFHNPALLGAEMDQMVNLNYLNYISDMINADNKTEKQKDSQFDHTVEQFQPLYVFTDCQCRQ